MSISNLGSNQIEVRTQNATILFSYDTPVAACVGGEYFRTSKKWSKTTSKHINAWLDGRTASEKGQSFFDNLAQ